MVIIKKYQWCSVLIILQSLLLIFNNCLAQKGYDKKFDYLVDSFFLKEVVELDFKDTISLSNSCLIINSIEKEIFLIELENNLKQLDFPYWDNDYTEPICDAVNRNNDSTLIVSYENINDTLVNKKGYKPNKYLFRGCSKKSFVFTNLIFEDKETFLINKKEGKRIYQTHNLGLFFTDSSSIIFEIGQQSGFSQENEGVIKIIKEDSIVNSPTYYWDTNKWNMSNIFMLRPNHLYYIHYQDGKSFFAEMRYVE